MLQKNWPNLGECLHKRQKDMLGATIFLDVNTKEISVFGLYNFIERLCFLRCCLYNFNKTET